MLHLPILRQGRPYASVEKVRVPHFRSRETFVEVSQANAGLVRRDLLEESQWAMREALAPFSSKELIALSARTAQVFMEDTLPLGESSQTPDEYVRQLSATTGLPHVLVRRNMDKIRGVLAGMETILAGLTRNLDLDILERGMGESGGHALSFIPRSPTLGIVLPSNSPGVHSLWVPTIALRTALVLKPGGAEPWTPYRLVQAFIKAGAPAAAFGFYPTDHAGAGDILRRCGRGVVFGDVASTRPWQGDPRVEVHGPGYSKVVLGPDLAADWARYLEVMAASIADNGGRSCVNASGVWTTGHAPEIAEALAERLARIVPRHEEDPEALLAPFADPRVPERISAGIDRDLQVPGAVDLTARHRSGGRVASWEGGTYLLPTVVLCDSPEHPLANREFLFPFASVVPVKPEEIPARLGPTLAATALTNDRALLARLLGSPLLHRLNLGAIPTYQVSWDQPHEGNLFEHLYVRRALQGRAGAA
ncbi:MAG: aldehyde dehydrogenase [Acidobacteria bacterium]|nr:MAG: aldehyde dehydrogenase [Acidobacteriota bacterium]